MGFGLLFSACSCSFWLDTLRNCCGSPGERHTWVLSHRPHHVLVPAPSRHVIQFVLVSGPERRPDRSILSLSLGKAPAVFSACGFPPELGVSPPICWAPARWMSPEPHQGRKGSSHRGCLGRRSKTKSAAPSVRGLHPAPRGWEPSWAGLCIPSLQQLLLPPPQLCFPPKVPKPQAAAAAEPKAIPVRGGELTALAGAAPQKCASRTERSHGALSLLRAAQTSPLYP